jgi:hypothetical protein
MTAPRPDIPLLADLDAGLLDEARAREVRAAAEADPAARAVLEALAATRAELAALPDPPVPPGLRARWSAALEAEQARRRATVSPEGTTPELREPALTHSTALQHPTPADGTAPAPHAAPFEGTAPAPAAPLPPAPSENAPPDHHPAAIARAHTPALPRNGADPHRPTAADRPDQGTGRPHRRSALPRRRPPGLPAHPPQALPRRRRPALLRRPAVLAGALLLAVLGVSGLLRGRAEAPPTVERPQLVAEGLSSVGLHDTGGLDDPARRAGCLRAAAPGVAPDAPLLGGRRVTYEGEPGVLLVLGTGERGTFDIVIVDPVCGPARGQLLTAAHVGPPR